MRLEISDILNIAGFTLFCIIGVCLQTTFFALYVSKYLIPDFLGCVLIYLAIKRNLREGVLFTVFISYLISLNSSFSFFDCLLLNALSFFIARYIGLYVFTGTTRSIMFAILVSLIPSKLILAFLLGWPEFYYSFMILIPFMSTILLTSVIAPYLFKYLVYFDRLTGRIEPAHIIERTRWS